MQIGLIGLGRMGHNMAQRLISAGHQVVVYDRSADKRTELEKIGAISASSIEEMANLLTPPRAAWVMVPHGEAVDIVVSKLQDAFEPKDIIIDGGNSPFLESIKRYHELKKVDINFVDVGVSGGIFGLKRGYCIMVGGDKKIFDHLVPIFDSLAPGEKAAPPTPNRAARLSSADRGYYYCGNSGSGHYVKMIHNAIEYGIMQSYAEGFELLKNANAPTLPEEQRYELNLDEIAELWRRGSVIGSWLLDLIAIALNEDADLSEFSGIVPDSGEGRWALIEAIKQRTPAPNLASSLFTRFRSRQSSPFSDRLLSALRKQFGGHEEGKVSS